MFLKHINFGQLSVLSLIASNAALFALAVYYQLSLLDILMMFWGETLVIGFYNFIKMIKSNPKPKMSGTVLEEISSKGALQFAGGFVMGSLKRMAIIQSNVLLAGFCFISLAGILIFFGDEKFQTTKEFAFSDLSSSFLIGVAVLFVSHGISFFVNFIGKKEYERTPLRSLIFAPFRRILMVWLVIVAGAFILLLLKNDSLYLLIPYFLVRLFFDLRQHHKEHQI